MADLFRKIKLGSLGAGKLALLFLPGMIWGVGLMLPMNFEGRDGDIPGFGQNVKGSSIVLDNCPEFVNNLNIIISSCADEMGYAIFQVGGFVDDNISNIIFNPDNVIYTLEYYDSEGVFIDPTEINAMTVNEETIITLKLKSDGCADLETKIKLKIIPKNLGLDFTQVLKLHSCEKNSQGENLFSFFDLYEFVSGSEVFSFVNINNIYLFAEPMGGGAFDAINIDQEYVYKTSVDSTNIYTEVQFSPLSTLTSGPNPTIVIIDTCTTDRLRIDLLAKEGRSIEELVGMEILSTQDEVCRNTQNILLWTDSLLEGFNFEWFFYPSNAFEFNPSAPESKNYPSIRVNAKNTTGARSIFLKVTDACGRSDTFPKPITIINQSFDNTNLPSIVLKQPNNILVFPAASYDHYQWGYTDQTDPYKINDVTLPGEIFQDYIAGSSLDTTNKEYWVEVGQANDCFSRIYFNTVVKSKKPVIQSSLALNIFPNPNSGSFQLELDGAVYGAFELQLFNNLGRLFHQESFEKDQPVQLYAIDRPGLPGGVYFARVIFRNGKSESGYTQRVLIH